MITHRKEKQSILESKAIIEAEHKKEMKRWEDHKVQLQTENEVLRKKMEELTNTHTKEKEELNKDYVQKINALESRNQALLSQLDNDTVKRQLLEEIERLKDNCKKENELSNKAKVDLNTVLSNNVYLENEMKNKYFTALSIELT